MSNYVKLATDAGDQYLAALAELQETYLKTLSTLTPKFAPVTPPVEIPAAVAASFPTPQEVTEATFGFAQKLLKLQKGFAEKLVATSASTGTVQ